MRKSAIVLLGIVALALLVWQWLPADDAATAPQDRSAAPSGLAPDRFGLPADGAPGSPRDEANARELVATADPATEPDQWTVQLTGIEPAVPWTAPLQFVFEESFQFRAAVDARGTCRFLPPAGARHPGIQNLRLAAEDDHYRIAHANQRTDALQRTGRTEFAVYPIARLHGRVLGPDGIGLVARVRAFACEADGPHEPVLASTDSSPDGSYVLRVPPGRPLLLLAEAVAAQAPWPWDGKPKQRFVFMDLGLPTADDDVRRFDQREGRADLVPAALRAEGLHGTPRSVPDLRLGATAVLTGRATFADGRPLADADVIAQPEWATTAAWHERLHWSPTHGLVAGAQTRTDARGTFALPLLPGAAFRVRAAAEDPVLLAGEPGTTTIAPGHVELQAPGDLVGFRVVAEGKPVPNAWLDLGDAVRRTDAGGTLRATLGPQTLRVRARADVRASAPVDMQPGERPSLVVLELVAADLAEARLVLRSEPALFAATFLWQPIADGVPFSTPARRERGDAPFVLRVPAGRYRVTVCEAEDEPDGAYLLPVPFDVDVPPAGLAAVHDVAFGGSLALDVLDANGTRVRGTFVLRDASGRNVTPRTRVFDESGDRLVDTAGLLHPASINQLDAVLPSGDYALALDPAGRGRVERTVTVRAGATTTVSLRLP